MRWPWRVSAAEVPILGTRARNLLGKHPHTIHLAKARGQRLTRLGGRFSVTRRRAIDSKTRLAASSGLLWWDAVSRDRDPFERALDAVRLKLRAGEGLQGRPLAINLLARELSVSQTPVREALAWLAGEGLVVRTHAGYVGRTYEATNLAELYRLQLAHILAALSPETRPRGKSGSWQASSPNWPITPLGDPGAVFDVLVSLAGDRTLLACLRRTREPLSIFLAAEVAVIGDSQQAIADLGGAYPDPAPLKAVARAYYRRRISTAGRLLRETLERLQI